MNDIPQGSVPAKPGRSRRTPKPSFDQFTEFLKLATVKPPKIGLPEVRRIFSIGFEEPDDPRFVKQIAEILKICLWVD